MITEWGRSMMPFPYNMLRVTVEIDDLLARYLAMLGRRHLEWTTVQPSCEQQLVPLITICVYVIYIWRVSGVLLVVYI